jgi:hypothetical protein
MLYLKDQASWCGRRDLNPHGLLRLDLNQVRLPISPLPHIHQLQPPDSAIRKLDATPGLSSRATALRL